MFNHMPGFYPFICLLPYSYFGCENDIYSEPIETESQFLTEELTTRALENAGDKTSCLKQGGYSIAW